MTHLINNPLFWEGLQLLAKLFVVTGIDVTSYLSNHIYIVAIVAYISLIMAGISSSVTLMTQDDCEEYSSRH